MAVTLDFAAAALLQVKIDEIHDGVAEVLAGCCACAATRPARYTAAQTLRCFRAAPIRPFINSLV